jgi:hypothetical protein
MIDHSGDVGKGAESIRKNAIWLEAVNENMKQLLKTHGTCFCVQAQNSCQDKPVKKLRIGVTPTKNAGAARELKSTC